MYKYNFLDWCHITLACEYISKQMREDGNEPDAIVGLLRGGVIPARIFADHFNVQFDFFAIDVKYYTGVGETMDKPVIRDFDIDVEGKTVLIVDDIWDSGKTMEAVQDRFEFAGIDYLTATICWRETCLQEPDYHYFKVRKDQWEVFPWERNEIAPDVELG